MGAPRKNFFTLAAAGTLAAVLGAFTGGQDPAHGQAETTGIWTYRWTAPTSGAPVAYYDVQFVANGRDTTVLNRVGGTTVHISVDLGSDYMLRVRAFNSANRPGPYSAWSVMETFEEAPPTNTSGSSSG